jgi:hypothetical protein
MSVDENTRFYPNPNDGGQTTGRAQPVNTEQNPETENQSTETTNAKGAQPESTRMEVNEAEVEEILATLEVATENKQTESKLNVYAPLDKYTDADMPHIHMDSPAGLLEGLDRDQARKWLLNATGKVLARPFDRGVHYQPNHHAIAMNLIAATCKITGTTAATVATPNKGPKHTGKHPITFLIHNLTPNEVQALLNRPVWSSNEITFQVAPLTAKRPGFLFTLKNFTSMNDAQVYNAIMEIWNDAASILFFDRLVLQAQIQDRTSVANSIQNFLKSTYVQRLDTKIEGGKPDPQYNVYADGQLIPNDTLWYEIRAYLKGRVYRSADCGKGRAKENNHSCGLCHGCDHPRGLCPFPKVPGWNGGGNRTLAKDSKDPQLRGDTDIRRNQKRPYDAFQAGQHAGPSKPRCSFGYNQ